MAVFEFADSRMPMTSMTVISDDHENSREVGDDGKSEEAWRLVERGGDDRR